MFKPTAAAGVTSEDQVESGWEMSFPKAASWNLECITNISCGHLTTECVVWTYLGNPEDAVRSPETGGFVP